jgi:hypothetical protein
MTLSSVLSFTLLEGSVTTAMGMSSGPALNLLAPIRLDPAPRDADRFRTRYNPVGGVAGS